MIIRPSEICLPSWGKDNIVRLSAICGERGLTPAQIGALAVPIAHRTYALTRVLIRLRGAGAAAEYAGWCALRACYHAGDDAARAARAGARNARDALRDARDARDRDCDRDCDACDVRAACGACGACGVRDDCCAPDRDRDCGAHADCTADLDDDIRDTDASAVIIDECKTQLNHLLELIEAS